MERIIPQRVYCDCGEKVKNHHWLCDKCYSKQEKKKAKNKKEEFLRKNRKNKLPVLNPSIKE